MSTASMDGFGRRPRRCEHVLTERGELSRNPERPAGSVRRRPGGGAAAGCPAAGSLVAQLQPSTGLPGEPSEASVQKVVLLTTQVSSWRTAVPVAPGRTGLPSMRKS